MAGKVIAGMVPDELVDAAYQVYAERTEGQGMPPVSPSVVVRYALATLVGIDPSTAVLKMGRPRRRAEQAT